MIKQIAFLVFLLRYVSLESLLNDNAEFYGDDASQGEWPQFVQDAILGWNWGQYQIIERELKND